MKNAINNVVRRRKLPECERCHSTGLQIVGDGLRCQHCGHQQGGGPVKKLSLSLLEPSSSHYEQPHTEAPAVASGVGDHHFSLNPLGINSATPNYQQPDVRTPSPVQEAVPVVAPPVAKGSDNYQQPDAER